MASIDYVSLASKVKVVIDGVGRELTFVALDGAVTDSDKPWELNSDERGAGAVTETVKGVFVDPVSSEKLGLSIKVNDLFKTSQKVFIMGASLTNPISNYNEITDDGVRYKIDKIEELKPASVVLLYFVGVSE